MSFFEFPHTRTYDSDLGWLIKDAKTLDEITANILQWIAETQPTIDDLEKLIKQIESGDLPEGMKEGILKWCETNLYELIAQGFKGVFFKLTNDGYFVAIYPKSWKELKFGTTGLDIFPSDVDYGHLTISY